MSDTELFQYDENFPGIPRKDWWKERPRAGDRDYEGYTDVEKAWVLDKATRHCLSYCRSPGDEGWQPDMARGWHIKQNGVAREVSEKEFVEVLMALDDETVKVTTSDGFWCIKI